MSEQAFDPSCMTEQEVREALEEAFARGWDAYRHDADFYKAKDGMFAEFLRDRRAANPISTLRFQQSSEVERLREMAQKVIAWWDHKLANELSSNRDFAWAEDAEFDQFQDLRTALARSQGDGE